MIDMDLKNRVASNLRELMRVRGMTQEQVATGTGVPQPQISRILRAKDDLRASTIDKLANGLRIDQAFLVMESKPILAETA